MGTTLLETSSSSSSCEICGWIAAVLSITAFGSFGVPIKGKAAKDCDIDPLCMQTYKTIMCLLTSWFVLLWNPFSYTPWGIVSGLFWVPGGVATVFAIKNAGLAIAMGVGGSCIVLVSFTWGIMVFNEHVHSRLQACVAVMLMLIGLIGMAYYSAPSVAHSSLPRKSKHKGVLANKTKSYQTVELEDRGTSISNKTIKVKDDDYRDEPSIDEESEDDDDDVVIMTMDAFGHTIDAEQAEGIQEESAKETAYVFCCGVRWQRRLLGILAAAFNGCYGGSIMVRFPLLSLSTDGSVFLLRL
jgi:uncharacterized membrane protein